MNSKDQNEETMEEKETTEECKEKGHPIEESDGERKPIEKVQKDGNATKNNKEKVLGEIRKEGQPTEKFKTGRQRNEEIKVNEGQIKKLTRKAK